MSNKDSSPKKPLRNIGSLFGIGIEMGIIIFASNYFGKWLGAEFKVPKLEAISTLVGVFISIFLVVLRVNKFDK